MRTALSDYPTPPREPRELMLAELKLAHARLLQAMSQLEAIVRGPMPTKDRIIDARWGISRASLARRVLWNSIFSRLSDGATDDEAKELRLLQLSDMALLRSSSDHVMKWNVTTLMLNWPEYCEASNAIRWKMRAAIGAEQRILYPMLLAAKSSRK